MPGKRKIVRMHPAVAGEFEKVVSKLDGLADENRRLASELQDEKRAREALERQEVHIDDMPGKQLPFKYQINIPLPGGTERPVTGTVNVNTDGPFICRRIYASVLITSAPSFEFEGGGIRDFSDFVGRYCPITSRSTFQYWSRPITDGNPPGSFIAPPLDFTWEYIDSSSDRKRQDKPISGDILTRHDDDGYLMNNELFVAGTTISFTVTPERPVTTISWTEDDETLTGEIDIDLQITFDGFKVLQPLEM